MKLPPPSAKAGKALQLTKQSIASTLAKGPAVFKVGLAGDPLFRFYKKPSPSSPSPGYFYDRERYEYMHVVYAGATWDEASLMEAVLISEFLGKPGNRNINSGGEGRKVFEPPFFTYVVFKPLSISKPSRR